MSEHVFQRRSFISGMLLCALAGWVRPISAHTPYQQWVVYRKKHLIIGTCRSDQDSYPFGKSIAELLLEELPESKARAARAPSQQRLASLLTTEQLNLILLTHKEATQLHKGQAPFKEYGPYDVKTVYPLGHYLLVSGSSFPNYHAWLVAQTLSKKYKTPASYEARELPVPIHPGLQAHLVGEVIAPEPLDDTIDADEHTH